MLHCSLWSCQNLWRMSFRFGHRRFGVTQYHRLLWRNCLQV